MGRELTKEEAKLSWIFQLFASVIFLHSSILKLSGASYAAIFYSAIVVEPYGRIASACGELLSLTLLLIPRYAFLGGIIGACVSGADLFFMLTVVGLQVNGDGGHLFLLTSLSFISCVKVALYRQNQIPFFNIFR